jgi:hypothetical protein
MSGHTTTQAGRIQESAIPLSSGQMLINLIVTLLAPMFLTAAGGDIVYARMAAAETLEAYRPQTLADLINIAQVIAFGLAAIGSLSQSMEDNISLSMTLRLRSNANACNRSAEKNRRALENSRAEPGFAQSLKPNPENEHNEAELVAAVAETRQRTAEHLAQFSTPQPAAAPAADTVSPEEKQYQATWAASAAEIAAETTANLANLPPAERWAATLWATALNDCANDFLAGDLPPRPLPGDLAAILRSSLL